jgi:RNA 3'-phosphate cyclase
MIEIDGSMGEGGGQILRTSLALASLRGETLRIFNIRKKRPKPGLAMQHLMSVKAIEQLTGGRVEGARKGSTELVFYPGEIKPGRYVIDIGTAGSVSLVLQTLIPSCLFASRAVELVVRGGTDVRWSPPVDYVRSVFLPFIKKMGAACRVKIERRGYYPKGGGLVRAIVNPVKQLNGVTLTERGDVRKVEGIAHSRNLPRHIIEREAAAARERLGYPCSIQLESGGGYSTGTGIVLWAICEHSVLGASALGEVGKKAEKVGEEAAVKLLEELKTGAPLDSHMGDQVIPYLAIAQGESAVRVARLTPHLRTNIDVVEEILGVHFSIDEDIVHVSGVGLINKNI